MESLILYTDYLAGIARSYPFIILLLGTGIYLTIRLRGIQFRDSGYAFKVMLGKMDAKEGGRGEVSNFEAVATVLSGTIGTGNIAGVATAITLGGPGALFWMWITALLGMAIKFACCLLGHHFRRVDETGEIAGGPMYTLKYGLNMPILGAAFAVFTLLAAVTTGAMVQTHSVVDGLIYVLPAASEYKLFMGIVIGLLVGIVILGGIKRIARMASIVVPFMAIAYCCAAFLILITHTAEIPKAFGIIFHYALNPSAAGGAALGLAIQYGVLRALFASEAGLGTAPIGLAAAKTNYSVHAGLLGMIGPWIDTIIICTMTGLVIIITGAWSVAGTEGLIGAGLSAYAFENGLTKLFGELAGTAGAWTVGLGLVFFAYTTIIAWAYYGDRAIQFLIGAKAVLPFRLIFILFVVFGALSPLHLAWNFADIANVCMAIPNLISIILLASLVKKSQDTYFSNNKI
ncbi:MAG: sodium:alanine symporter family protein [Taibaiella sp.]|jgi:AGCS family alanine or glycine:cation symporter